MVDVVEMLYMIKNNGCDDTTTSVMKLNKNEYRTLSRFIRKNNKNGIRNVAQNIYGQNDLQKYKLF